MKKILLMLPAVLMASMAFAQDGEPKTITLTDAERQLVVQNSDFAFNLFRKTRDTVNHVISPLSVTYALGMLDNGADGVTREEICQVLSGGRETGYADVATMNAFCRKMLTESALLDKDTRVAIANSIFFNGDRGDVSLKTAFKDSAATYYDATPAILSCAGHRQPVGLRPHRRHDRRLAQTGRLGRPQSGEPLAERHLLQGRMGQPV